MAASQPAGIAMEGVCWGSRWLEWWWRWSLGCGLKMSARVGRLPMVPWRWWFQRCCLRMAFCAKMSNSARVLYAGILWVGTAEDCALRLHMLVAAPRVVQA